MNDPAAWAEAARQYTGHFANIASQLRATNMNDPDARTNTMFKIMQEMKTYHTPPKRLPCALAQAQATLTNLGCQNPGIMMCSGCKLVGYCSTECQNAHWKEHKRVCKNGLRAEKWIPSASGIRPDLTQGVYDGGSRLWNTYPPVDLINLKDNENDLEKDFNLAFLCESSAVIPADTSFLQWSMAACGDIRDLMQTINSLPPNYSGKLNVVLNDTDVNVSLRNLVILLTLGRLPDIDLAADIVLQYWFSIRLPTDYIVKAGSFGHAYRDHLRKHGFGVPYPLDGGKTGPVVDLPLPPSTSSPEGSAIALVGCSLETMNAWLDHMKKGMHASQEDYERVRVNPLRDGYWEWRYSMMRGSHRASVHTYRTSGILLPFGGVYANYNSSNNSLFSRDGKWLQTDSILPLQGWNISEVVESGKAHGTQSEDIFGCLYFHIISELRTLAQRLRTFNISITLSSLDPEALPQTLKSNTLRRMGLTPATRFDRIDLSNLVEKPDSLKTLLTTWTPLLRPGSEHAAVVGRYGDWGKAQEDVRAAALTAAREATEHEFREGAWDTISGCDAAVERLTMEASVVYDPSEAFAKFLEEQGLDEVLREAKLRLRSSHRLVPHRIGTPVDAPPPALPTFVDKDEKYYHKRLIQYDWTARSIELELDIPRDTSEDSEDSEALAIRDLAEMAGADKDKDVLAGLALLLATLAAPNA
ncbi:hypothetical protein NMY22_g1968 [Coprinellus aureogranulatus]|nr:hypothetical protein NMY22_g1968 [Coprinellus aureogranulatus]